MTTIAFGVTSREPDRVPSQSAIFFHVSGGFQSMKKQGPPPCGMNRVGITLDFDSFVIGISKVQQRDVKGGPPMPCNPRPRGLTSGACQDSTALSRTAR